MAKKHPEIEELEQLEAKDDEERTRLYEATRKVVLASVGAGGLTQDWVTSFVNRLVKRGEIAERDARKLLTEATDRRNKNARSMDRRMEKQLNRVMNWMNIPSKKDIDELSDQISELTVKVEELKKEKSHA